MKMKTRWVSSAFGGKFVKSNWSDEDWDSYHFRLKLRASMGMKVCAEHRHFNADEKKFIAEMEVENDKLRGKYGIGFLKHEEES